MDQPLASRRLLIVGILSALNLSHTCRIAQAAVVKSENETNGLGAFRDEQNFLIDGIPSEPAWHILVDRSLAFQGSLLAGVPGGFNALGFFGGLSVGEITLEEVREQHRRLVEIRFCDFN